MTVQTLASQVLAKETAVQEPSTKMLLDYRSSLEVPVAAHLAL